MPKKKTPKIPKDCAAFWCLCRVVQTTGNLIPVYWTGRYLKSDALEAASCFGGRNMQNPRYKMVKLRAVLPKGGKQ